MLDGRRDLLRIRVRESHHLKPEGTSSRPYGLKANSRYGSRSVRPGGRRPQRYTDEPYGPMTETRLEALHDTPAAP